MGELEDIILTIDTREQNQIRIKAVEDYFTGHGAIVEHSALKHCDYRLVGECRDVSVNIGVEAKSWDNFLSDSIDEMEEKLLLATAEYDHVGFFVATQNYTFVPDENNKHGKLNYSIPRLNNKDLPSKTLAAFEGMLDTISKHPQIHVRQLRGEAQFPYSLYDLLVYLQSEHGMTRNGYLNKNIFLAWYKSLLAAIPSLKSESTRNGTMTTKRIVKVIRHYPNLFWLCSASEESLMQVMGKQIGMTIYTVLHYDELITPEWKAGHHLDGIEKDEPESFIYSACGLDKCTCVPNFDNPLLKKDDKGKLRLMPQARTGEPVKVGLPFDIKINSCDYANSKNREECKTPNHFKHEESIAIMAAIEGYLSGFSEGRTANEICEHFNIQSGDSDKEKLLKYIKQLAWEERITSEGQIFKNSSHAEGTILSNHNPLTLSADPHTPPKKSAVKQGVVDSFLSPAEIHEDIEFDIGLDNNTSKYREVKPNVINPKATRMSLEPTIKEFLSDYKPHTMQEIVDHCKGWGAPHIFDRVMANVKSDNIKKVTEQDGRITFQRIE